MSPDSSELKIYTPDELEGFTSLPVSGEPPRASGTVSDDIAEVHRRRLGPAIDPVLLRDMLSRHNCDDIILVEDGFVIEPSSSAELLRKIPAGFQARCVVQGRTAPAHSLRDSIHRILVWIQAQMVWWLLGSRKHGGNVAAIRCNRPQLLATLESVGSQSGIAEIIALLRAEKCRIENSEFSRAGLTGDSPPVTDQPTTAILPVPDNRKQRPGKIPAPWKNALASMASAIRFWWCELKFPGAAAFSNSESGTASFGQQPALKRWELFAVAGLLLGSLVLLGNNLGYTLFEPDEARNAELALNIVRTGQWASLELGGQPYWDKPPLMAWSVAAAYRVFGISEFSTRLPGALCGVFTVLATWFVARRMTGAAAAVVAAGVLLGSLGFVIAGRYVTMDMALTALATVVMYAAWMATESLPAGTRAPRGSRVSMVWSWWVVSALAGGLGLLMKGPVVVVVTLPALVLYHWMHGNRSLWAIRPWLVYGAIVLVVCGPWFIGNAIVYPDFLRYYFWKHHVVRFSDAFNHQQPWWFYGPVLLLALFPASASWPVAVRFFADNARAIRMLRCRALGLAVLQAGWIVGFFSLSESKLPTYILPAFPALAIILAAALVHRMAEWSAGSATAKWFDAAPVHVARFLLVTGTGIVIFVSLAGTEAMPLWHAGVFVMGLAIAWIVTELLTAQKKHQRAWSSLAAGAFVFILLATGDLVPRISGWRSVHGAVARLQEMPEFTGQPVVFYCHETFGIRLSIPGLRFVQFDEYASDEMAEYLDQHPGAIIVSTSHAINGLLHETGPGIVISRVEDARHLFVTSGNQHPLPQVLVAERCIPYWSSRNR